MTLTRRQGLRLLAGAAAIPVLLRNRQARAEAGDSTRLILLGTGGGPTPLRGRNQPASVLVVNGVPYVVDAGNGVGRQLMLAGIGTHQVGHIFVTHHHDDHTADLGTLMGLAWSNGRTGASHAYGPPGTEAMIRAFVDYFRPNAAVRLAFSGGKGDPAELFAGHDIAGSGEVYSDENVRVTCVENTHYPHGGMKDGVHHLSYSYRFETADRTVVFSGDTSFSDDLIALASGADVLVHEIIDAHRTAELFKAKFASQGRPPEAAQKLIDKVISIHTTQEDVGRVAQAAGVRTLVLNHFVPGYDPDETDEDWTAGVRKHFGGEIIVGRDLMEI
ncbi:MAG: MBL fold metallo-hydrolase [Rhizobiaceae bacterium]